MARFCPVTKETMKNNGIGMNIQHMSLTEKYTMKLYMMGYLMKVIY